MIKTLKKIALAFAISGATLFTITASAVTSTNVQVLENVSIQLKVYGQGALKTTTSGKAERLPATLTTLTTSDVIKQLGLVGGFATTKTDKLVSSTIYSNFLFGIPGTAITNSVTTLTNALSGSNFGTNLFVEDFSGTNNLVFFTGTTTNSYYVTNVSEEDFARVDPSEEFPALYEVILSGTNYTTNFYTFLTNNLLFGVSNSVVFNTNVIYVANSSSLLCYTTFITPAASTNGTNVIITQVSPVTQNVLTNISTTYAILTGLSGTGTNTTPVLIPLTNFVQSYSDSGFIYSETGTDLSATNDFAGTNISSGQTIYSVGDVQFTAVYATNGQSSGNLNLSLDPYGFIRTTTAHVNLTTGGTAKNASVFLIPVSSTATVSGNGIVGGTFTTNYFTVVGTQTNFNYPIEDIGGVYVGTNLVESGYLSGYTNVVYTGVIQSSYYRAFVK